VNRSNLNTANINGAVLDPVQRGFVALVAAAIIDINRRALVRGPLTSNPTASTTLIGRALRRAVELVTPTADVDAVGRGFVFGEVNTTARATITAVGTAQPPGFGFLKANVTPRASIALVPRKLRKLFVTSTPRAQIAITGNLSYTIHPGEVDVLARAVVTATGERYAKANGSAAVIGRANIALTGKNYYSLILGSASVVGRAQVVIDFEVRKQIPYDEDAPDERTMLLPEQDRTMVVT
jgi:hypothetical protein